MQNSVYPDQLASSYVLGAQSLWVSHIYNFFERQSSAHCVLLSSNMVLLISYLDFFFHFQVGWLLADSENVMLSEVNKS